MPEKRTTESDGTNGTTTQQVLLDSFPTQRQMPEEGTTECVSERPSNRVLSNLSPSPRQMSEERTSHDRSEHESIPTVYHMAKMQREDARCLEDPLSNSKPRPKERKTLQFASGNSEDGDDVPDAQPRHISKAKSNAKVGQNQQETRQCYEVHDSDEVVRIVKSRKTSEWDAAPSIIENSTLILAGESSKLREKDTEDGLCCEKRFSSAAQHPEWGYGPRKHVLFGKGFFGSK